MEMNKILFDVLVGVMIICIILITRYLIPYIKRLIHDSQYAELLDIIEQSVDALEQTIKQSGMGKVKKAEVVKFVTNWLNEKEITISEEQLDKLIESAVFTMNNGKK